MVSSCQKEEMQLPSVQIFLPKIPDFTYGKDLIYKIKAVNQKPYPRRQYRHCGRTLTLKGNSIRESEEFLELAIGEFFSHDPVCEHAAVCMVAGYCSIHSR